MGNLSNPFRPGAGHTPPYLAGRDIEKSEFKKLLNQDVIMQNLVLTGLRGVGKTVLSDTFKPMAQSNGWLWVGTDMSEAASLTEERIAIRLLTDLSVITSSIKFVQSGASGIGFTPEQGSEQHCLTFDFLLAVYHSAAGLVSDKLKHTLEFVWQAIQSVSGFRGIIFAYDEAQNLGDHAENGQMPLSLLLDVFQSLQRRDFPLMLALTGLPTLFPKLVDARTYAERMFRVLFLDRLNDVEVRQAVEKPLEGSDIAFSDGMVDVVVRASGGYPYFVQFICREVCDMLITHLSLGFGEPLNVREDAIINKLDTDFFAGRWANATDRQRELLYVISKLETCDGDFTVQEIVEQSKQMTEFKRFSSSHINQMLGTLSAAGLVYKTRFGKYAFAVPLMGGFVRRQFE